MIGKQALKDYIFARIDTEEDMTKYDKKTIIALKKAQIDIFSERINALKKSIEWIENHD